MDQQTLANLSHMAEMISRAACQMSESMTTLTHAVEALANAKKVEELAAEVAELNRQLSSANVTVQLLREDNASLKSQLKSACEMTYGE